MWGLYSLGFSTSITSFWGVIPRIVSIILEPPTTLCVPRAMDEDGGIVVFTWGKQYLAHSKPQVPRLKNRYIEKSYLLVVE